MGEKIVVGPVNRGLRTDVTPFNIDNDAFPTLINAYQWRGRVKRKRGTSQLGRLTRFFNSTNTSYNTGSTTITLDGSGIGNILSGFSLQSNGNIVPGSVALTASGGPTTYTDPTMDGYLTPTGTGGVNTINYASGVITIPAQSGNTVSVTFLYYPDLPVMGIEDLVLEINQFPGTLAFDTVYSYNVSTASPYDIYDVSFYKNPPASASLPGYTAKTYVTPTTWNGQDYQQFWTVNYQGALWATNGINTPFSITHIGMQYKPIVSVTVTSVGPPAIVNLNIVSHGLVVGDFLFINEVATTTGINLQTGYVKTVVDANNVTVEFPQATIATNGTGGIAQYLTNRSDTTVDCLRWYDGDPTNANATNPTLNGNDGWVNFAPPLSNLSYSIGGLIAAQYYLVGAKMIIPFKDSLLFFGPVVQTSVAGSQVYLRDTVIYSQNGTAYYTSSFTGAATSAATEFTPILVPVNQTATANAYFNDEVGFGGFITAGVDQAINTAAFNEDVIIVGFDRLQTRLVYSGIPEAPFVFYSINSELGSGSTFSTVILDKGVLTKGTRGFVMTTQTQCARFDLDIPDKVFEISSANNGSERVCSARDFINEWIYFTFADNDSTYKFPNQTLLYNYRDNSWATFEESYTTYGLFRKQSGFTWATVGNVYPTWQSWNAPWNAGTSTLLQPDVLGGNQQGFLIIREDGTDEEPSLEIQNISFPATITGITKAASAVVTATNQFIIGQTVTFSGVVGMVEINGFTGTVTAASPTQFTVSINSTTFTAYTSGGIATPVEMIYSPNHNLNQGDYIIITGALGTVGPSVNNQIFSVNTPTTNGFSLLSTSLPTSGNYFGGGEITHLYVPYIQSKQFPVSWGMNKKTRLGPQQYLLTTTPQSQITLLIFLSQDSANAYNDSTIVPDSSSVNSSLVYSTVLYTCPESTNLGLTPANINLQMVTANTQQQIWHRMNTSLLGDTVQVGFTLSDTQMRSLDSSSPGFAITGVTLGSPTIIATTANFSVGQLVSITGIVGTYQLNNGIYYVTASSSSTASLNVDSTNFGMYISGGLATAVAPLNQTAEIEIHGFILDVNPSMVLA